MTKKKLYSISELINENISLKKRLEKQEKQNVKQMLFLVNNIKDYDLEKLKKALELQLYKLK